MWNGFGALVKWQNGIAFKFECIIEMNGNDLKRVSFFAIFRMWTISILFHVHHDEWRWRDLVGTFSVLGNLFGRLEWFCYGFGSIQWHCNVSTQRYYLEQSNVQIVSSKILETVDDGILLIAKFPYSLPLWMNYHYCYSAKGLLLDVNWTFAFCLEG